MENTMVKEKEQSRVENHLDSLGGTKAAVAACEEGDSFHEAEVLRLFFEARMAFVKSLPYRDPINKKNLIELKQDLSEIDRGITGHYRKYAALNCARQKLSEFCKAFDEHPNVYMRLEPQLKVIVQATAKIREDGLKNISTQ